MRDGRGQGPAHRTTIPKNPSISRALASAVSHSHSSISSPVPSCRSVETPQCGQNRSSLSVTVDTRPWLVPPTFDPIPHANEVVSFQRGGIIGGLVHEPIDPALEPVPHVLGVVRRALVVQRHQRAIAHGFLPPARPSELLLIRCCLSRQRPSRGDPLTPRGQLELPLPRLKH